MITVNGYDASGGLWFSRDVEGGPLALPGALRDAWEVGEVASVSVDLICGEALDELESGYRTHANT